MNRKRIVRGVLGLTLAALALLAALPYPIDPLAYTPPPRPLLVGAFEPNESLTRARLLAYGKVRGPEDVAVDAEGRVYGGTADGRIVRVGLEGAVEGFAVTGGRPLGLRFAPDGRLIVCDAVRGLLAVDPEGRVTTLATEAEGVPLRFADGVDVARDGSVYFSDASSKYGQGEYLFDLLEARPYGRLLRYSPATGRTTVLLRDLYFANGVALSRDESFVLVNETYRYRITRFWLAGPKAGTSDLFADNLPGFPDGLSSNGEGTFWVALFTVRNPLVDRVFHPRPWAKRLLAKLPKAVWPRPESYGLIAALDEEGRPLRSLHDPGGRHVREITTAREFGGSLYFGTLENDWIGVYALSGESGRR